MVLVTAWVLATLPEVAADKIKLGILATLSGPNAVMGTQIRDGFNLALEARAGKLSGLPVVNTGLGASRAAADAGYAPNDWQVGHDQTRSSRRSST